MFVSSYRYDPNLPREEWPYDAAVDTVTNQVILKKPVGDYLPGGELVIATTEKNRVPGIAAKDLVNSIQIIIVPEPTAMVEDGRYIEPEELMKLKAELKYWPKVGEQDIGVGNPFCYSVLLSVVSVIPITFSGSPCFGVICSPFAGEICVREAHVRFVTTVEVLPTSLIYLRFQAVIENVGYEFNREKQLERVFIFRFIATNVPT